MTAANKGYSYPRVAAIQIDAPYKENPDQHSTHIPCSVRVWSQTIHISCGQCKAIFHEVINSDGQSHCSWEKGSRHNLQHDGWPIYESVPNFSLEPAIEAVEVKPPCVDIRLLGLLGPYHQHVIGTFNTLLTRANPSVLNRHKRKL
jgi:hypothetical protein